MGGVPFVLREIEGGTDDGAENWSEVTSGDLYRRADCADLTVCEKNANVSHVNCFATRYHPMQPSCTDLLAAVEGPGGP